MAMIVPSWKIRSSVILCLRCTGGITLSIVAYIQSSLRPVPNTFLSVRKNTERIPTKFAGGIITTTSRLSDYIFGEIGTRTTFFWRNWNRIREKIQIDVNRFGRNVKQVLTPSEWIHRLTAQTMTNTRSDTQFHVNLQISLTNFI